jgi:hypothetical protein
MPMAVIKRFVNAVFLSRLLVLGLALGAFRGLFALVPIRAPSLILWLELFLIGMLILHKRLVSGWRNNKESPLGAFYKSFAAYLLPASLLWVLFCYRLFLDYLPSIGLRPPPISPLLAAVAILALSQVLLAREISRLRRPIR